jgi:hypothetical protein
MNSFKNKNKKCDELTLMPRKSRLAKIGMFSNVVFTKPLLTNRGQRNTKNENPSPHFGGGIYRFSFFVNEFGTLCNIM